MSKVICVCNQKGGTGKSTTVCNLGIGLARLGKKVLLIDGDSQGSLTASLGYKDPDSLDGQLHYLSLITDEGIPDWVRGEWSSYTSPKLLEEFGAELGYKVKSLYNAFPFGSEEWYQYHYCAQAAEDGELYSICHVSETNCYIDIRSKENIPKIDFKNYPKYYLRLR